MARALRAMTRAPPVSRFEQGLALTSVPPLSGLRMFPSRRGPLVSSLLSGGPPALTSAFLLLASAGCGGAGAASSAGASDSGLPAQTGPTAKDDGGLSPPGVSDGGAIADGAVSLAPDGTAEGGEAGLPSDAGALHGDSGSAVDGSTGNSGKIVGGYYPNWTPSPVRIRDVDPHYNLIYLFAATPVGGAPGTTGAIQWSPPGDGLGAATDLNADIAYARATQGRKIVLSIGGAGNAISFPDRTKSQTFVDSVSALYTQLGGFDGIDWDNYEGTDSPDTSEMIWIGQTLKSKFAGFLITTPPAPWSTVDQTFCAQMLAAGALDYAAPQYYDGPNLATQAYVVPNVDTWVSLLGESHLVVGFGVANQANYMTVTQVIATWGALATNHPGLRGAFDWEIDVDQAAGWPFADQVGPLINP
jgi:chitinase